MESLIRFFARRRIPLLPGIRRTSENENALIVVGLALIFVYPLCHHQ